MMDSFLSGLKIMGLIRTQSGICSVCGGAQPCGRKSAARKRIGATSRPHVQHASVGRRRPWASSQVGGVMAPDMVIIVSVPGASAEAHDNGVAGWRCSKMVRWPPREGLDLQLDPRD